MGAAIKNHSIISFYYFVLVTKRKGSFEFWVFEFFLMRGRGLKV